VPVGSERRVEARQSSPRATFALRFPYSLKALYDAGKVHCRIVLKNVDVADIDAIRAQVAPTPADASFIAPFHIFEANGTGLKPSLDAAMRRLKGSGAVTIISTDTNHYGSAFTSDRFLTCK